MKKKIIKLSISLFLLSVLFFHSTYFEGTYADVENDNTEISENSILNYYLVISSIDYRTSFHNLNSEYVYSPDYPRSGYILVEDQIPDGLEFLGFYGTEDGNIIGRTSTYGNRCDGNVVDDTHEESLTEGQWNQNHTEYTYHGLHYDTNTRKVSFKIENLLSSGNCEIIVGIRTRTEGLDVNQNKIDFYNYAIARIGKLTKKSNLVHRYIGSSSTTVYGVNYSFDDTVQIDSSLLSVPPVTFHAEGSTVHVNNSVNYLGYTFDGWTTEDVTVTDGIFIMPNHSVNFVGHFTPTQPHQVSYRIEGEVPEGFILPLTKNYYPDVSVKKDILTAYLNFDGYEFQGWETSDIDTQNDNYFLMPNHNVEFVGRFVEKKHKITFNFVDKQLPPNIDSLIPSTLEYKSGDNVHIDNIPNQGDYIFAGWDYKNDFVMPDKDLTINGYWQKYVGEYDPQLEVVNTNSKNFYKLGEVAQFHITLKNDTDSIFKIGIQSNIFLYGAESVDGDIYYFTISDDKDIDGYYLFESGSTYEFDVDIKIVSCSQFYDENIYILKDKDYSYSQTLKLSPKLFVCQQFAGENNIISGIGHNTFRITGNNFATDISINRSNTCSYIYLYPGTYHIQEILPMEQDVGVVLGLVNANDSDFVIDDDVTKENVIIFINEIDPSYFIKAIGFNLFKGKTTCIPQ